MDQGWLWLAAFVLWILGAAAWRQRKEYEQRAEHYGPIHEPHHAAPLTGAWRPCLSCKEVKEIYDSNCCVTCFRVIAQEVVEISERQVELYKNIRSAIQIGDIEWHLNLLDTLIETQHRLVSIQERGVYTFEDSQRIQMMQMLSDRRNLIENRDDDIIDGQP